MITTIIKCDYFTTDKSYCNLLCPYILQDKNVKCKDCQDCGYNLAPNEDINCK